MEWIGLGVAGVAAVGAVLSAIFAGVQARQAEAARHDAAEARQDAEKQAQEALRQATLASDAQREIAAAVLKLSRRPEPWRIKRLTYGWRFSVTNASDRRVITTRTAIDSVNEIDAEDSEVSWAIDGPREWPAGDAQQLLIKKVERQGPGSSPRLTLDWREIDDDPSVPDRTWTQILG